MENNNLKLNKSEIARQLNVDRRTVDKYLNGFNKSKHRSKPSKLDSYKEIIQELLNSTTQAFSYRSCLYRYLQDNHRLNVPAPTFYHYLKSVPEFDMYFKKEKYLITHQIRLYVTKQGAANKRNWIGKNLFRLYWLILAR